jgi:hypothetical protein
MIKVLVGPFPGIKFWEADFVEGCFAFMYVVSHGPFSLLLVSFSPRP